MPVTGNDLRGMCFRHQSHTVRHVAFHQRIDMRICSNRPGYLARGNFLSCGYQSLFSAGKFCIKPCKFKPETDRLGMDAVASSNGRCIFMFFRARPERIKQLINSVYQKIGCAGKLHGQSGVQHIR